MRTSNSAVGKPQQTAEMWTNLAATAVAGAGLLAVFDANTLFAWHPTLIFVWLFCSGNATGAMQWKKARC